MFNKKKEENKRFEVLYKEHDGMTGSDNMIIVDTETGVNYLIHSFSINGVSITPLLGKDGKPVITPVDEEWY